MVVLVSRQPFLQRPPRVVIAGVVSWSNYIFFRNKNSKGMVSLFSLITRIQITMAEKKEFQYNSEDLRLTTSHETVQFSLNITDTIYLGKVILL